MEEPSPYPEAKSLKASREVSGTDVVVITITLALAILTWWVYNKQSENEHWRKIAIGYLIIVGSLMLGFFISLVYGIF